MQLFKIISKFIISVYELYYYKAEMYGSFEGC